LTSGHAPAKLRAQARQTLRRAKRVKEIPCAVVRHGMVRLVGCNLLGGDGDLSKPKWAIVICASVASFALLAPDALPAGEAYKNQVIMQARALRFSMVNREGRMVEMALKAGSPVLIRIFKKESELELWMQREGRFEHFETYPICFWSGKLGPKTREGDRQAPEGFYRVDVSQLRLKGRNARSFYIDFPNALDRALGRTGSAIMVHGRCKSIGCFAMTNPVMEEIYIMVERALREGQKHIEVHAFPFRMTESNLRAHAQSESYAYWRNLKEGYDLFEQTRVPPHVGVCHGKYVLSAGDLSSAAPDLGSQPIPETCDTEDGDPPAPGAEPEKASELVKSQTVARKSRTPRSIGRNTRQAYAAARRARVAAYARRMRTSAAVGKSRPE
jgi:murein L,D-transpeptidase YafK